MNMHLNAQFYQLETEDNRIMLVINYLTDKTVNWIQSYINKKFHSNEEKDKMFNNYEKFMKKIIAAFKLINSKKKAEHKLEHFKQKKSVLSYTTKFRQIVFVLNWNDEAYISLFYWEFKNRVKNKLIKIKWSDNLNNMIRITVQINNQLWKK